MGSLREIKDRIGSVKSTLKITSAMKLVASSKLRKSQKAIETMLPYREALEGILAAVRQAPAAPAETASQDAEGKVLIVAIASNSSLCGAFNVNAVKAALQEASAHQEVDAVGIGRKMAEALRKAGFAQEKDLSELIGKPDYASASAFAQEIFNKFDSGDYSRVYLVYNHFVSSAKQVPVVDLWLPETGCAPAAQPETQADWIFEPSAREISDGLRPKVLRLKFYSAILDSSAAENAARTIAMQTATDNAEEILSELTLEYNKGRQQKITAEILDLVGGSAE